jgi:hypothetical protein
MDTWVLDSVPHNPPSAITSIEFKSAGATPRKG